MQATLPTRPHAIHDFFEVLIDFDSLKLAETQSYRLAVGETDSSVPKIGRQHHSPDPKVEHLLQNISF
jgi:hypothetical protein